MAGLVKGLVGMGLPLVSITLMSILIAPKFAIPYVLVSGVVLNFAQVIQMGDIRGVIRRYTVMAIGASIGVWFGTELLFLVDQRVIVVLMGLLVCLYVATNIVRVPPSVPADLARWLALPVGLVLGLLHGTTGSLAAPLAAWWQALGLKKDEFVRASSYVLFIMAIPWTVSLVVKGAMPWPVVAVSSALLVPAAVGMYLGARIRARVPEERYRSMILFLLFCAGVGLLAKGLLT